MNSSNKQNSQQPLNPFRTQPRGEDHHVLFANPLLQVCYVVAVGALMVAVSVVAWTALSQLPSPHEDTALAPGPHRIAVADLTDVKIQTKQPPARMGGKWVRSHSRVPPPQLADTETLFETTSLAKSAAIERTKDHGNGYDGSSKEDLLSFHHDDELDQDDGEDTSTAHDAELLRPADAQLKFLGETKELVKQEMDQEEYSEHHVFGVQQDGGTNSVPDDKINADHQMEDNGNLDRGESADKDDIDNNHEVHLIRRKGGAETLLFTARAKDESTTSDKGVNATSRLQSIIEIAVDDESSLNQQVDERVDEGEHLMPEQAERGRLPPITDNEEQLLRHKRLPPIAITADE
jgi:hypothetical protein